MHLATQLAAVLAANQVEELEGGHQSRVFRLKSRTGVPAIAKVLDAAMVDRQELEVRLDVAAGLADLDSGICRPLLIGHDRITEIETPDGRRRYVVCFEFADGVALDPAIPADAERMGTTLACLHASMRQLPPMPLPVVAPLRSTSRGDAAASASHQLLHGDFNAGNLRAVGGLVKVFDLDDCGYGPTAFDVANGLYTVMFEARVHGDGEMYETFRRAFVSGYAATTGQRPADEILDHFIDLRVDALDGWIDDLDNAPIGIRTACREWHETLRSFVDTHRQ